ncbi:MAG: preprotein translocase subunit SecG [Candidatus Vogelbacteria bacterium]|nr:preprotein translocase subunit SecG [Candidatus Vogelbacteria bacterium]
MQSLPLYIPYAQIVLSILLIVLILLQKNEAGLGSAFGGGSASSFRTKRGFEKILFNSTIVISVLFVASAIIALAI